MTKLEREAIWIDTGLKGRTKTLPYNSFKEIKTKFTNLVSKGKYMMGPALTTIYNYIYEMSLKIFLLIMNFLTEVNGGCKEKKTQKSKMKTPCWIYGSVDRLFT